MNISCFFPMYNEEGNIRIAVSSAISVLSEIFNEFEVVIVNDGSRDKTKEIAEELENKDKRIKVINHEKNRGYGAALRSGFGACSYDIIFQSDGDNQFHIEEISKLLPYIKDYDFVVGYRIVRKDPVLRTVMALWYRFLLRLLFGLKLKDTNCAFKLFKKKIMDQLVLESNGATINGEIFVKARKLGYEKIKEVGINHRPRKIGNQKGANPMVLLEALISIVRLWMICRRSHD